MLKDKTAYLITASNANVLSHLSGFPRETIEANIGWCAVYDESKQRRWGIVPARTAVQVLGFTYDTDTYI